jgi:hypothetical protein
MASGLAFDTESDSDSAFRDKYGRGINMTCVKISLRVDNHKIIYSEQNHSDLRKHAGAVLRLHSAEYSKKSA